MPLYILPIITAFLCTVSFFLLYRDVSEHGLGEKTETAKSKKIVYIYSAIMIIITLGVSLLMITLYRENTIWTNVKCMALLCVMWPIALVDFKTYRIPNEFIIQGIVARVLIFPFELIFSENGVWQILLSEVIAAVALLVAALLCALVIKHSIGFGDMKLFVVMGLLLSLNGIWSAIFLSLIVSFIISAFLLITKRKTRKDTIPFGPALVIGTFLSICLTGM